MLISLRENGASLPGAHCHQSSRGRAQLSGGCRKPFRCITAKCPITLKNWAAFGQAYKRERHLAKHIKTNGWYFGRSCHLQCRKINHTNDGNDIPRWFQRRLRRSRKALKGGFWKEVLRSALPSFCFSSVTLANSSYLLSHFVLFGSAQLSRAAPSSSILGLFTAC